jgi:hypothetical protein
MIMSELTADQKKAMLVGVLAVLAASTAGTLSMNGITVGDEITLAQMLTASTAPRSRVSPEHPQFVFIGKNKKRFVISDSGLPAMRVLTEGKTFADLNAAMLKDVAQSPDVLFFKSALESLDKGADIDITKVTFKCVGKLAQSDATDRDKAAYINSCYNGIEDYRAAIAVDAPDFNSAREALHASKVKAEFKTKKWEVEADRQYFAATPIFEVAWNQ